MTLNVNPEIERILSEQPDDAQIDPREALLDAPKLPGGKARREQRRRQAQVRKELYSETPARELLHELDRCLGPGHAHDERKNLKKRAAQEASRHIQAVAA